MRYLVRDKRFYFMLMGLTIPLAAQNLINFAITMADTVMLGLLGEAELSAASIANQLGFVYMLFAFGVGSGCGIFIAQYWGSGEVDPIHRVMTITYRFVGLGSLFFTGLAVFFPHRVMMLFTADTVVIELGVEYLRTVGISYLVYGVTTATVFMLRGVGAVKISVAIYLASLAVNVTGNYLLIFGKLGLPALGMRGAALATVLARVVELVIMLIYMAKFEHRIRYRVAYLFRRHLNILRDYIHIALPVVLNELVWASGFSMFTVIMGRMSTQFVAANAICSVLSQFVTVIIFGAGNAAAVIVGNAVGAEEYGKAQSYAATCLVLSVCTGILGGGVVLLLREPIIGIYNISPLAATFARQIISVYAGVVVFQSFSHMALIGVLRGGGDTRFVFAVDVVFLWAVSIPLGFFTGLYLKWPVPAVYAALRSDDIFKSIFCFIRVFKTNWMHNVTKNKRD